MNNETVSLATINNPWQPHTSRETRAVLWHEGMTLAECAEQSGLAQIISDYDGAAKLRAGVNGKTIEQEDMKSTEVRPGDSVVFAVEPMNGGGSGGGKNALMIVAMIALVVVASMAVYAASAYFTAGSTSMIGVGFASGAGTGAMIAGIVAGAVVSIGGAMLIQSIMPGAKSDLSKLATGNWGEASQTYGWDLSRNINREGLAMAVIYGTMMVTPPVIASSVKADANGDQYLNILMAVGEGRLAIAHDAQYNDMAAVYLNGKHYSEYTRQYAPQPGTQNIIKNGTLVATWTGQYKSQYLPASSIDGSTGSYWIGSCTDPAYFPKWTYTWPVGQEKTVAKYRMYGAFGDRRVYAWYDDGTPKYWQDSGQNGWTLHGSNDGTNWDALHSVTTPPSYSAGFVEYALATAASYRMYEVRFYNYRCEIAEIEMMEEVSGTTATTISLNYNEGTNYQPALSDFNVTYSNVSGFNPVRLTTTFQTGETDGNAATIIGVFLSFPGGLYKMDDSGNIITETVSISMEYRIETSPGSWGSWTAFWSGSISASSNSPYTKYMENTGLTAGKYQIRAKFSSQPSTSMRSSNVCYWSALQTGVIDAFTYPNTAVLGLRAMATDQFNGGLPRVQCLVTRDTVPVRTSAEGVTPEVWEDKASNNPAWACYDMLTNSRYGAGVSPDDVLIDDFVTWAAYCDNMTTYDAWQATHAYGLGDIVRSTGTTGNGWYHTCTQAGTTGGTEPTWETTTGGETTSGGAVFTAHKNYLDCNIAFDTHAGLVSALGDLAQTGRANVVQKGGKYGVIIDRPGLPVQMFTMGNIVAGSFKISYLDMSQRANVVEITYFDHEREYQRSTVEVRTAGFDSSTDTERNAAPVVLYGCTDRDQAIRHGRFMLLQNAYNRRVIEFEAGADAIACLPGDVINFSHDVPQWGYSGRVLSYVAGTHTVTIDRPVTMVYGTVYEIQIRDQLTDTLQSFPVTNPATVGSSVTVSSFVITGTPGSGMVEAVYAFGVNGQSVKKYRVLAISRSQDRNHKITASEYDAAVYAEDTTAAPAATTSSLSGVYGLITGETDRNGTPYCLASWQGAAISFDVMVEKWNKSYWVTESRTETTDSWFEFAVTKGIKYRVTVTSVTPSSSETSTINIVADNLWNMPITCTKTYSDGKAELSQNVVIGWSDKEYMSESGNIAYSDTPTKDTSSGYGEYFSVKWPWKAATFTQTKYNDSGSLLDEDGWPSGLNFINTNEGKLYFTFTDRGSGEYSVELFSDASRTQQVAHTENYTTTESKRLIQDNDSGVNGRIVVNTLGSDSDIYVEYVLTPNYTSGSQYAKKWDTDFREEKNLQPWIICVAPGTSVSTCSLSWDSNSIPLAALDGLFIVEVDPLGFAPIPGETAINMSIESTLSITPGSSPRYFRVFFGTATTTQTLSLVSGWNYISLSVFPQVPWLESCIQRTASLNSISIFDAANGYYISDAGTRSGGIDVAPMVGIIAYSAGAQTISITGIPVATKTKKRLLPSWNLVGVTVDFTPPISDPKLKGFWYKYFNGGFYPETATLHAGVAYWIYANEQADFYFNP